MTGLARQGIGLNAKRLQLFKESIPKLARVGVLVTKNHQLRDGMVAEIPDAARKLKVRLQLFEIASNKPAERIDAAVEATAGAGAEAVLGHPRPFTGGTA